MSKLRALQRLWQNKKTIGKVAAIGGLTAGAVSFMESDSVFRGEKTKSGAKLGAILAGGAAAASAVLKPKLRGQVIFRRIRGRLIPMLKKA